MTDIYAYKSPEGLVWGITGDILRDFLNRYHQALTRRQKPPENGGVRQVALPEEGTGERR